MKVRVVNVDNNYQFSKNPNQIKSVCPEYKNLLVREEINSSDGTVSKKEEKFDRNELGGLACVTYEAAKSLTKDAGVDIRTMIPYTNECHDGSILLVRLPAEEMAKKEKNPNYILPNLIKKEWIHKVSPDYEPAEDEFFAYVAEGTTKDEKDKLLKYKYIKLEPIGIKGQIDTMHGDYTRGETINYRIFKQSVYNEGERYFIYTPHLSAMRQAYGGNGAYHPGQVIGKFYDKYYADFDRIAVDCGRQFCDKYGFNPASVWLHDRPSFAYLFEMVRRSADGDRFEDGKKVHSTLHNPGRDYQGWMGDIESFLRIAFDKSDFVKLKSHPQFYALKRLLDKPKDKVTDKERKIIEEFFAPYFESMIDELGTTNQTMIPVAATSINPENSSVGTVSKTYGFEMITLKDIAKGLTTPLFSIKDKIINITNGSLPASLNIDNTNATFGNGGNGISSEHKIEYTPFKPAYIRGVHIAANYDKPSIDVYKEKLAEYEGTNPKLSVKIIKEYLSAKDTVDNKVPKPGASSKEKAAYKMAMKTVNNFDKNLKKLSDEKKADVEFYIDLVQKIASYEEAKSKFSDANNKYLQAKKINDDYKKISKLINGMPDKKEVKISDLVELAKNNNLENVRFVDFAKFLQNIETEKKKKNVDINNIEVTNEEIRAALKSVDKVDKKVIDKIYDKIRQKKFNEQFKTYSDSELESKYKDSSILISDVKKLITEKDNDYKSASKTFANIADEINIVELSMKDAKNANKKWILDLVSKQYDSKDLKKTKLNLEKLFFSDEQRTAKNKQFEVYGHITKSKDGRDKIFANWGRPDNQKGFSTFLQGYYKFLTMKEKDLPKGVTMKELEDMKLHAKLIFGSGSDKWDKTTKEFKIISEYIQKIQKLENGKYAGNVCYVDGFFPNRLIACCDFGFFTSRFEPCGITPLEAYAAGTPVASIRTGGAPDFVFDVDETNEDEATGFLTQNAFMRNDSDLESEGYINIEQAKKKIMNGETKWDKAMDKEYAEVLDDARRESASDEVAHMFVRTMKIANDEKAYDNLCKNCFKQLIEWAKNNNYNRDYNEDGEKDMSVPEGDLSPAEDILLEEVFGVTGIKGKTEGRKFLDSKPRSTAPMKKLTGEFPEHVDFSEIDYDDVVDSKMEKLGSSRSKHRTNFGALSAYNGMKLYLNNLHTDTKNLKSFVG